MTIDLDRIDLHPTSGSAALAALHYVSERFRATGDPRAAFPDIYGLITRRCAVEAMRSPSNFLEPAWISRLVGRFCERYLETLVWSLEGRPQDCAAWSVAYRYAAAGSTIPFQDVVLGLSAHINYDLALGISATIREFGDAGDPWKLQRYKHDHDHVNVFLREAIPESFHRVAYRYGDRMCGIVWSAARPLWTKMVMATLSAWREHVWMTVLRLLRAKNEEETRTIMAEMDRRSGRIAQAIVASSHAWLQGRDFLPSPLRRGVRRLMLRQRLEHGLAAADDDLELDGLGAGLVQ